MADNFVANAGSGGSTFASDDVSGVQYPRVKISRGRDGTAADVGQMFAKISDANTNATVVKGSAGVVYVITAVNLNAAVRYLKFYNKATAPTVGTDAVVATFPIPASLTGAGFVLPISCGWDLSTGIGIAITTGYASSDTGAVAAGEIFVKIVYV